MAENHTTKKPPPPLQKPPGYRDPAIVRADRPSAPPPRRQPLPPAFRHAGKPIHRHRPRRRLCCYLAGTAVALALLLAAAAGIAYLYYDPRLPSFRLQSLKSPHLAVATKPDGTFISASVAVRLYASNPSGKIDLDYGPGEATVAVAGSGDGGDDVDVGTAGIEGFDLAARNWTVVRFATGGGPVSVDEVNGSLIRTRFKRKEIRFKVVVRTRVGLRLGRRRTGRVPVRVECGPVSLKQGMSGDVLFKCPVYLFRWIKLH